MKGRALFLFIAGLSALALVFCSGNVAVASHGSCPLGRVAYVPSVTDDSDPQAIFIDHTHLSTPSETPRHESHRIRLRGLQRTFSVACLNPSCFKTTPVASASLTSPPRYNAPNCLYPQHNYLFRLTPF